MPDDVSLRRLVIAAVLIACALGRPGLAGAALPPGPGPAAASPVRPYRLPPVGPTTPPVPTPLPPSVSPGHPADTPRRPHVAPSSPGAPGPDPHVPPGSVAPAAAPPGVGVAPPAVPRPRPPQTVPGRPVEDPATSPGYQPCEGAQILAKVGGQVILASEVTAAVNLLLQANAPDLPERQREYQRKLLTRKMLDQLVEVKLVLEDALRHIPAENLEKIQESLAEQFEEKEVPKRIEKAGLSSREELDRKLRQLGTSLEREKRAYADRMLAQHRISEILQTGEEIPVEEVLAEYQRTLDQYQHKPQARWVQLTLKKSNHPDPAEARALLARLGNRVLDGAPFAEIAAAYSEESGAARGKVHDWVTQGSLVSEVLDQAIFGLPVGRPSRILEDDEGYHIVLVVDRREACTTPFVEAQVEIRKRLEQTRRKERLAEYLARLRDQIPVWTVFDDQSADRRGGPGAVSPRW